MFIQYGGYRHPPNECQFTLERSAVDAGQGRRACNRVRFSIMGLIIAPSHDDVSRRIQELHLAYSVDGRDLVVCEDGGSATPYFYLNAMTLYGIRVVHGPSFPTGDKGDYSTWRTFTVALEWEEPAGSYDLLSFTESVSTQGDGSHDWGYLVPLEGDPQAQEFTERSLVKITQRGRAVGRGVYPPPSMPLIPSAVHGPSMSFDQEFPGLNTAERVTSWSYTMILPASVGVAQPVPRS